MIQGVREVFEIVDMDDGGAMEEEGRGRSAGKIVFIGRGLDRRAFEGSLDMVLRS